MTEIRATTVPAAVYAVFAAVQTQYGESLFLRKIFPGFLLEKSAKITRPLMPSAAPIRPASLVSTQ